MTVAPARAHPNAREQMLKHYASSSDSGSDTNSPAAGKERPSVKKRKALPTLPILPTQYLSTAPNDDPTKHQGRIRTRPYVDGDYDAHIYIDLELPVGFRQTLNEIAVETRRLCPDIELHSFLYPPDECASKDNLNESALHVSLTHPLPLRRSQIQPFQVEVAEALRSGRLYLSLVPDIKVYFNGRRTGGEGDGGRAFMALRLGAGAEKVERLVDTALHPVLRKYHLPLYHKNPEYHASFAWHLLRSENGHLPAIPVTNGTDARDSDTADSGASAKADSSPIDGAVLANLSELFAARLLETQPRGGWKVSDVKLKVAKTVRSLPLGPP